MKKLILFYILAISISAMANEGELSVTSSGPKDCSIIQAQWDQMGLQLQAKNKECDALHEELVILVHKRVEAFDCTIPGVRYPEQRHHAYRSCARHNGEHYR